MSSTYLLLKNNQEHSEPLTQEALVWQESIGVVMVMVFIVFFVRLSHKKKALTRKDPSMDSTGVSKDERHGC